MPGRVDDPRDRHPEEYSQDLNPHAQAGRNYGLQGPHPEKAGRTLYDIKEAHERFAELSSDELKRVPIMPVGSRLLQGATYADLNASRRIPFTAMGGMTAGPNNWYTPKHDIDYEMWNHLVEPIPPTSEEHKVH